MYPNFRTIVEKLVLGVDMPGYGMDSYREVYQNPTLSELVEVMYGYYHDESRAGALFSSQGMFVWNRDGGPTHETVERKLRREHPTWTGNYYPTMIYYKPKTKEFTIKHATWNSKFEFSLDQFESTIQTIINKYPKVFAPFSSIRFDEE